MVQYSATFDSPNKVYRLGLIEAHQQRLVKQIEVASVLEEIDGNTAYVNLLRVDIDKQRAQIEINTGSGDKVQRKTFWIKQRDDLYTESGERLEYQDQWVVDTISFDPEYGYIDFANGQSVALGQSKGSLDDDVMRAQVHETVREHLEKELRLRDQGIKVLSLFFIDKVANYRVYHDDGTESLGKIGQWFEEPYTELTAKYERFRPLAVDDVSAIHDGYFSIDKKGRIKDTTGKTADDESTYDRIMKNKEKLLSFDDPLRFIFSHSTLREGWDNPNVFQICTLKETKSVDSKRQEIGRGLRLPVN
jgi:type III restriction enzyme